MKSFCFFTELVYSLCIWDGQEIKAWKGIKSVGQGIAIGKWVGWLPRCEDWLLRKREKGRSPSIIQAQPKSLRWGFAIGNNSLSFFFSFCFLGGFHFLTHFLKSISLIRYANPICSCYVNAWQYSSSTKVIPFLIETVEDSIQIW